MKRFHILYAVFLIFTSCNLFSSQNLSNNWRWRNKKFDDKIYVKLDFNPHVIKKGLIDPMFYEVGSDTLNLISHYQLETVLKDKLKQRNIIHNEKASFVIQIDTLHFKEYKVNKEVYFLDGESEDSEEDHFLFTIIGQFIDNTGRSIPLKANISHHTSPRESYFFDCMVAKDGINANEKKMISNTLNDFSHQVFKAIEESTTD